MHDSLPGLAGRVALVTGANHGIGAATAQALAANGASVVVTYLRLRDDPDPGIPAAYGVNRLGSADDVVDAIRSAGGAAHAIECDLADASAIAMLFDEAEAHFGPVEILVNNASGWVADTFTASETDDLGRRVDRVALDTIDRVFGIDARAAALLISEFARRHIDRGARWGRIVGLTSGGAAGFPGEVSYGAAKAAQENFTMSAARELIAFGVTANMVHPPVTDTGWVTDELREMILSRGEHVAAPVEVAAVVAYLASDSAALITANVVRLY